MTMSPDPGGIFDTLFGLARHGFGGSAGHGRQFISWIHYEDFVAAVRWLIDREDVEGIVNVAAPNPLPNAEFMRVLREAGGVSFGLPASKWMLEIGAVFMRTETELILKSRRVVPSGCSTMVSRSSTRSGEAPRAICASSGRRRGSAASAS